MPLRCEVGDNVGRIGCDRDRRLEERLLPAARCFTAERDRTEQCSGAGPETADVCASVRGASFVEPNTGNLTVTIRTEFQSRSEEHTSELQSLRHLVCR